MKKILGISAFYHDSAAAIIEGSNIIAAAQEERFTREKHTANFPVESIKFCLKESGTSIDELDGIIFYDKPLLKFERLLETYYAFAPKGLLSFLKAIPVWLDEKLFLKRKIYKGLKEVEAYKKKKIPLFFSEHHLSHAASAFFPSPFKEAAILTIDGVGEWATTSIAIGKEKGIEVIKEIQFPHSVGLLYSAFTYYLGFKVNSGEYKLMGLAPYGNPNARQTNRFIELIKEHLIDIKKDGSLLINQEYFSYATGLRMVKDSKWNTLFGIQKRKSEAEINQTHCNLALAIQKVIEEIVILLAKETKKVTGSENLCLAGGVALNCVANGKILKQKIFKEVFIQPASGDAGGSLGAALALNHIYFGEERTITDTEDSMKGSYLGPYPSEKEILQMNNKLGAKSEKIYQTDILLKTVAKALTEGKVVGWFQGKMEFGPRALGNRSILGDPSFPEMQKTLNLKIKQREGFRPFAPAVLEEDATHYFDLIQNSPYMLTTTEVSDKIKSKLPANFYELPLLDRLYVKRSDLQAITHLDYSARVQTVNKKTNTRFWDLLNEVKSINGKGVLVNTSFNVRGEPIVCTAVDAYRCFMNTEMDILVIENFLYYKEKQPNWKDSTKWKVKFKAD